MNDNNPFRNCRKKYIIEYNFKDLTKIINNEDEAILYSDKYYEPLNDLIERLENFIRNEKEIISHNFIQYDANKVNDFKKEFYHIVWNIYKDFDNTEYDKYFEQFVDDPINDMQGAARCLHNIPVQWNNLISLGNMILSFDDKGRKFDSFNSKCNWLDTKSMYDYLENMS